MDEANFQQRRNAIYLATLMCIRLTEPSIRSIMDKLNPYI